MKINRKLFITLLIGIVIFYIIPHFGIDMSKDAANNYACICILFINSIYVLVSSILLTKYDKFKWYYALLIGLLFIPSVVLYFNKTSVVYSLLYITEYLIGSSIYIKYSNR